MTKELKDAIFISTAEKFYDQISEVKQYASIYASDADSKQYFHCFFTHNNAK